MRTSSLLLLSLAVLLAGLLFFVLRSAEPEATTVPSTAGAVTTEHREPAAESTHADLTAPVPEVEPEPAAPVVVATSNDRRTEAVRSEPGDAELEDAHWVVGRVVFPPGTPTGERVVVHADGRDFEHREQHSTEVEPDGSFRVAFAPRTRKGTLRVTADHLYDPDPERFDVRDAGGEERVLELELGGRVEGVLVPPALGPDELARLAEERVHLRNKHNVSARDATIGTELSFEFGGLEPGQTHRVLFEPGWLTEAEHEFSVTPGETVRVELSVQRGVRLAGTVAIEGYGSPEVGQQALLIRVDGDTVRYEGLEPSGEFDIAALPPGDTTLRAVSSGAREWEQALGVLADGEVREGIEIVLDPGAVVSGVLTWPDGSPAGEVTLSAIQEDDEDWSDDRGAKTGVDGRFAITGLVAGPVELLGSARPELPREEGESEIDYRRRRRGRPSLGVRWLGAAPAHGLVLALSGGTVVTGRVVDDLGAGIADFKLTASPSGFEAQTVTRNVESIDGTFVLEGLTEGVWELKARADGHVGEAVLHVEVPSEPVLLELPRSPMVRGLLVTPDGGPPERRGKVEVRSLGVGSLEFSARLGQRNTAVTFADGDGSFRARGLVGRVEVVARAADHAVSAPVELELEPGQEVTGVHLRLRRPGRIQGVFEGPTGGSIGLCEDVQFGYSDVRATVDSSGSFAFENLDPGDYVLEVLEGNDAVIVYTGRPSGNRKRVTVVEGETTHVTLSADTELVLVRGRVWRGDEPAVGCRVQVHVMMDGEWEQVVEETGGDGSFELSLPSGNHQVHLVPREGGTTVHTVKVPEVDVHQVDLRLFGGSIAGLVVDQEGAPVEGVSLLLTQEGSRPIGRYSSGASARSASDGAFGFFGLADGEYSVMVWSWNTQADGPAGGVTGGRLDGIVVADGAAVEGIELRVGRPATVTGVVRTDGGGVVPEAAVFVRAVGEQFLTPFSNVQSDDAGRFHVERVPADEWTIVARHGSTWGESSAFRLSSGDEARVDVVLSPATVLAITVRDGDLRLEAARLSVRDAKGLEHGDLLATSDWMRSSPDATHVVGALPPGTYRVRAWFEDGAAVEREVRVNGEPELRIELSRD